MIPLEQDNLTIIVREKSQTLQILIIDSILKTHFKWACNGSLL